MQIISNIALISINETLIVQLISFLIFLFIINRIMFRPLRSVIEKRQSYIEKVNLGIINAKETLEGVTGRLKEKELTTKTEAYGLQKELEHIGNQEASDIFATTNKEITMLRKKTEKEVDAQIFEARKKIQEESEKLTVSIMEKLLDRKLVA